MTRWIWFTSCTVLGLIMLLGGLLMPVHLRAIDSGVIQAAGGGPSSLIDHCLALVQQDKLGPARLLSEALPGDVMGRPRLVSAINELSAKQPGLNISGGDAGPRLQSLFASNLGTVQTNFLSLTEFVIRLDNRDKVLELVRGSQSPGVHQLLQCRSLTNTSIFSPSASASGQAFDAAISIAGLLLEENRLTPALRDDLVARAASANHGANSQPLEQVLLDLMSLGQRFNWGQLVSFVSHIEDAETLRVLAEHVRNTQNLPVLFSAVELSGQPAAVCQYLGNFSQTGMADLKAVLVYGPRGVTALVRSNERLSQTSNFDLRLRALPMGKSFSGFTSNFVLYSLHSALALQWLFYFMAGFLLASAVHFAQSAVSSLEQPLEMGGFHIARELLFALGFLVMILLVTEPFLSQDSQKMDFPIHVRLPSVGNIVPSKLTQTHPFIMNQLSLLTLVLFFVLQGLLYIGSILKLAEIRRQRTSARIKLRLLENEDHLFDAGLYLGFVGTIISLILVSLGVIKPSLMAAYSSTSFGIIFVSIFKICQLRPERRRLLMEAEATAVEPISPAPATAPILASTP